MPVGAGGRGCGELGASEACMPEKGEDELGGDLIPGLLGSCPMLGLTCAGDVPADGEDAREGVAPATRMML